MANNVIDVSGVVKDFGATRAVDGVDLSVPPGELFGLIGHNGAGKTTLFKMLLGLIAPSNGTIRIGGEAVGGSGFRGVRKHIGYLPENVVFYDHLTGIETLGFFAKLKGAPTQECLPLLERLGLSHAANRQVSAYSKGMRQRLAFAQALLGTPRILFLDEPTNGLDPQGIQEFYAVLRERSREGVTVVLTSHILAEIQQRVDRLALMRSGKIQALGTVESLREALALPLGIAVRFRPEARAVLQHAVAVLPTHALRVNGEIAEFRCAHGDKMEVLGALAKLGGQVLDIQLHEPSLEDVFMGYRDSV